MKTICDLPVDLVEDEIISRVPMTSLRSVRSTCKKWNTSCKNRIIFGKAAKKMMVSRRISLMNIDLSKDNGDLSIRQVSVLDQIQISNGKRGGSNPETVSRVQKGLLSDTTTTTLTTRS
ncbi:hypothetical protein YC2023_055491 [Brassica napus]